MISDNHTSAFFKILIICLILGAGFVGSSFFIANAIKSMHMADRFVTVKGFSERQVKSNRALWEINFTDKASDLKSLYAEAESHLRTVVEFAKKYGFQENEIIIKPMSITDKKVESSSDGDKKTENPQYIAKSSIAIKTNNVDAIYQAKLAINQLINEGIVLGDGYTNYYYTKLNDIKPDMLAEATRSARKAAEQFAKNSNSHVGQIRRATQGIFTISSADQPTDSDYGEDTTSLNKKIRVVTTLDFFLDKSSPQ